MGLRSTFGRPKVNSPTESRQSLLCRLRERRDGMPERNLSLRRDVYRSGRGRKGQHDHGLARRIGGHHATGERACGGAEENCPTRAAAARPGLSVTDRFSLLPARPF